jgi:hypothetical protein
MLKLLIFSLFLMATLHLRAGDYDHHSFEKFNHPQREQSFIFTKEGFYPATLSVFEGEKVKLFVTSTLMEPACLMIKDHDVYLAAQRGKISEGEVVFNQTGEYLVHCPGFASRGKIIVLGKTTDLVKKTQRDPAAVHQGKSDVDIWTPKEY